MNRKKIEYLRFLADMGEIFIPIPELQNEKRNTSTELSDMAEKREFSAASSNKKSAEKRDTLPADKKKKLLDEFYHQIRDCTKCALSKTRHKFVFGAGNADADIMFIGEAPGGEEDLQGIPFVGRAGKLLDRILAAARLKRSEVYIANVLKCRPPKNRDPLPSEEEMCLPYLHRQIEIIQPKIICCLGRVAAHALLRTKANMSELRGQVHKYRNIPMIVTYHPAALLRSERFKKPTWEDFLFLLDELKKIKSR